MCVCVLLSYGRLCDVVDHVFPLLARDEEAGFPCSDTFDQCTYWSEQLQDGPNEDEEEPQPLETSWGNPIESIPEETATQLFSACQTGAIPWSVVLWIICEYFRVKYLFKNCVGKQPSSLSNHCTRYKMNVFSWLVKQGNSFKRLLQGPSCPVSRADGISQKTKKKITEKGNRNPTCHTFTSALMQQIHAQTHEAWLKLVTAFQRRCWSVWYPTLHVFLF